VDEHGERGRTVEGHALRLSAMPSGSIAGSKSIKQASPWISSTRARAISTSSDVAGRGKHACHEARRSQEFGYVTSHGRAGPRGLGAKIATAGP